MSNETSTTGRDPMVFGELEVAESIASCGLDESEQDSLAQYVERACHTYEWNKRARLGQVPPYEYALRAVVLIEKTLRALDGRLRDGSLIATGFTRKPKLGGPVVGPLPPVKRLPYVEPEPHDIEPVYECIPDARDVPPFGYMGEAGTTNGGVSGYNAVHEQADDKNERPLYGVDAFRTVEGLGVPELAWFYSASALELGMSSSFDAMVQAAIIGPIGSSSAAPMGPTDFAKDAAERQAAVRSALRQLWPMFRVVLEMAYEDRRRRTEDVMRYGHGVANIMARLDAARRDLCESPQGEFLQALQRLLMALTGNGARGIPYWQPMTSAHAKRLLFAAQAAYVSIRSGWHPPKRKKSKKPPKRAELVAAEVRSMTPRRKLYEVVHAA